MHTSKLKKISLAVCLAILPLTVFAAGLGKLIVNSNLGEPFQAEIELLATTPEELDTLLAVVASEDAYVAQGITRLGIHNDIKIEVVKTPSRTPKLVLKSNQVVNDPYLDMLIQLDWASGRLQREYTVLLDPPNYKKTINAENAAPITAPVAKAGTSKKSMPSTEEGAAMDAATDNPPTPTEDSVEQLPVKKPHKARTSQHKTISGDNLSKIASTMRVSGVSLDQMLVGLYEQNKDAFVDGNMNRLKVGKIIKLPSKDALLAATKSQASETVKLHTSNWQAYRTGLASAVPTVDNSTKNTVNQSEAGKITPQEKPEQTPKPTGQDVVKLSAGDQAKLEKDAKKADEAKKTAAQEDAIAHDKALAEAHDRTNAVEKQIEDMQKLLALKNKAMTDLQKKAEAENADKKAADSKATPPAETTPPVVEEKKPESQPAEVPAATDVPHEAEKPVPHEEAPAPVPEKPVEKPAPVVVPPTHAVEEPSFFDNLKEFVGLPALGGLGAIALLGGGWMYLRNKRRKDLESFERGILTSGGLRANTVFGNTTGSSSSTDTSFLTDFAQSSDGSMIDTNEVDPIAEAEVYMAYGRDAQAEEILKDAISKEPKRYELHLKLLEMYAARKDNSAFEAVAGELYTTLGAEDPTWEKVAVMGKALEPENPLYDHSGVKNNSVASAANQNTINNTTPANPFSPPAFTVNDSSMDGQTDDDDVPTLISTAKNNDDVVSTLKADKSELPTFAAPDIANVANNVSKIESIVRHPRVEPTAVASSTEVKAQSNSELTLQTKVSDLSDVNPVSDELRIKQSFESASVEDISFDTDLDLGADDELNAKELATTDLNFDLDTHDKPQHKSIEKAEEVANLKAFDLSTISLDLDDTAPEIAIESPDEASVEVVEMDKKPSTSSIVDANEVEVKLNLVAAYIDMEDKEGARELLDEVMKEGNEEQITRAQLMLDSIS